MKKLFYLTAITATAYAVLVETAVTYTIEIQPLGMCWIPWFTCW